MTTKTNGSRLQQQPEEEPLVVPKVIRQYTRKKKVESAETVNKLASTTSINVTASLSNHNNSIFLVNDHVKIKEEIVESFHDIQIMDVDVEIENHVKTEERSESQNGVRIEDNYVKEESIVPNASYNSDLNRKYGKANNHVEIKENVTLHKDTLIYINLHQINSNINGNTIKIKEESVSESVMNNDASMKSNLSETVQETAKITIKIEPEDDSQYINLEQKQIDGFPTDSQSEENIAVGVKPKAEKINCNVVNGKMDSRYSEKKDVQCQNCQELAPILKLQQTVNVANVQAPQKKILITEEIDIKEEAISDSEDCVDVKDMTPVTTSSTEVKDKTPITASSIEIKDKTPVTTSSVEVKDKTLITAGNIELKDKTPVATSSIEVKDKSPVVIKKNPLPEKIKIRRIMNMPKILKTYGRKQPDPVALKKCFLFAVSSPPAKILKIVSQKLPKIKAQPSNPKFICDMCRNTFRSKVSMSAHMRLSHGVVMRHSCPVCSARFPHHYLMLAHWRAHAGAPLACHLCPNSFRSQYKYGQHLNTHLRERLFPCPVCLQRYPLLEHLQRHAKKHTQEDTFPCNICKESYRSLIDLKRHSERDHGEKEEFPCYVCSRILSPSADFLTHVGTHDNVFHVCAFCPRQFTDAQKWEEHSTEHIEKIGRGEYIEKPYKCEYCKKTFEYKSVLTTHIRMHTGERPYECPECKKKLKTRSALTEHVNGHKRPYPCPVCKQRFGKRDSLSRHILLHTGERPHACTGCPMTFVQRSSMLKHIRRIHEPGLKRVPKNKKKNSKKMNKNKDC